MKWRSLPESAPESGTRRLYEIYADRKELIAKYVPAEIQAIHARVVDELKQSGIADRTIQCGAVAPAFELPDHNGKIVPSADLLENGPLVICFIRGRWCPFCVGQLEAMNAIVPRLHELGASLVAISPQTVHHSYLMADQHKLQFPLLSDAGNHVARQFGLLYRVPEYQQEVYRRVFVNLPLVCGDNSWALPIPATFIVGDKSLNHREHRGAQRNATEETISIMGTSGEESTSKSVIAYASANPDYTDRPEPVDILRKIQQLSS